MEILGWMGILPTTCFISYKEKYSKQRIFDELVHAIWILHSHYLCADIYRYVYVCHFMYTDDSQLRWFNLQFFDFMMVWKQYVFSRICTSHFEFWSFPQLVIYGRILSHDVGLWQPQFPVNCEITGVNNTYTVCDCVKVTVCHFWYSDQ